MWKFFEQASQTLRGYATNSSLQRIFTASGANEEVITPAEPDPADGDLALAIALQEEENARLLASDPPPISRGLGISDLTEEEAFALAVAASLEEQSNASPTSARNADDAAPTLGLAQEIHITQNLTTEEKEELLLALAISLSLTQGGLTKEEAIERTKTNINTICDFLGLTAAIKNKLTANVRNYAQECPMTFNNIARFKTSELLNSYFSLPKNLQEAFKTQLIAAQNEESTLVSSFSGFYNFRWSVMDAAQSTPGFAEAENPELTTLSAMTTTTTTTTTTNATPPKEASHSVAPSAVTTPAASFQESFPSTATTSTSTAAAEEETVLTQEQLREKRLARFAQPTATPLASNQSGSPILYQHASSSTSTKRKSEKQESAKNKEENKEDAPLQKKQKQQPK